MLPESVMPELVAFRDEHLPGSSTADSIYHEAVITPGMKVATLGEARWQQSTTMTANYRQLGKQLVLVDSPETPLVIAPVDTDA